MKNNNQVLNHSENDSINLRAEIEKYIIYWKWFLFSVVICTVLSILYLKSEVNVFETRASILIKEDGGASSDLKVFQDLSSLGLSGPTNNVFDEIQFLNSRTVAVKTVKKLKLNFEVFQNKGLKKVELFENIPFNYHVLSDHNNFYELDTIINLTILSNNKFQYNIENSDDLIEASFGEKIKIKDHEFLLSSGFKDLNKVVNNSYEIVFNDISSTIEKHKKNMFCESADDNSNIIVFSYKHSLKSKSELILNTIIDIYNEMSINDKNQVALKTSKFISSRLESVKVELDKIDELEEKYKKDENITDIQFQSEGFVSTKYENDRAFFEKEIQLKLIEYMIDNINKQNEKFELLPSNIGIENNIQLGNSVFTYNELLSTRNKALMNSTELNPIVINYNRELISLKNNIKMSLQNSKEELQLIIKRIKLKEKELENKIKSVPKQIRMYRNILRSQEIISQLYTYLLEKKEENQISMAVVVPISKVIDVAYTEKLPIAPNKKVILLMGIFIGVFIPFLIIFMKELLDTKFHSRAELERYVTIPILGDIPFDRSEEKVIIKQGSRTSSAEAFRLLRTNLDFILSGVAEKSKIIFVTSTISGEGKTFISVNTASSIALTGKKVLLVGMDLRAPKITQYLGLPNRSGVSNYLIGQEDNVSDLVFPLQGFDNLDVLSSGIVPPNPAELLLNTRLQKMFVELRQKYDYIVVDTAPVNLVTDTLMMSKHADMFVYVARANYLDKRMLELSEKLYQEKRIPNMTMLINGMDHERVYGYGVYGYGGYGYPDEEEKKNFFQRVFKF